MPLDQPHGDLGLHARFTERMRKMKLPTLRKPKLASASPTITEASADSSDATSTLSSVSESRSTSLTAPSTASLSLPVTQQQHRTPEGRKLPRPKSDCYSSKRQSIVSSTPTAPIATSPLAPRLLSVQDNQWVHQNLLLVFGQVGAEGKKPSTGLITVHHHLDAYPLTKWPISDGYFKALVRLDPGPNKLRFEYNGSRMPSSFSTNIILNMLPLIASPPLHLAILVGKNSTGGFEGQSERQGCEGNSTEMALRKLRMAAYLAQAFTGEQMYRQKLGRRCFRLEEEWSADTLSNGSNGAMRNIAKVHILRSNSTADEIRELEKGLKGAELLKIVQRAVEAHFGRAAVGKRYVGVVVLDARGDLQIKGITHHSALSDGIGMVGSRSLYTLPSCIEEVVSSFSDCTRINNPSDSGFFWEAATAALGVMIEAFLSPQSPVEPRNLEHVNRTFVTKEPYSLKAKLPGLKLSLPEEECSWSRLDCLRLRYHPCFRLPTDPILPGLPDIPQIYTVENGIVAGASSGITLILVYAGDSYQDYIEYTTRPERETLLQEDAIRKKLTDVSRSTPLKLKIFSAGQGDTTVENFHAMKNMKFQLPNGHGSAYRSLGFPSSNDSLPNNLILDTLTSGRLLIGIRVFCDLVAVGGLEFLYDDGSNQLFGRRNSDKDAKQWLTMEFSLDPRKGETLVGFCIRAQRFVEGIEILTSFGRRSPIFGNSAGGTTISTLIPPRSRAIAGVAGTFDHYLDGFSILYT